jgi:hypothetical protein
MRSGDFSEINRVIYDPTTGQPFAGNVIPSGRIDSVARNILTQLYPEPNTAGTRQANGQVINNYLINPIKERQDNQFDVKVEAFNLLNHPQFGNPNTTVGNAAYGTISTMLSNPSCSLCGTVERQVQLGVKVKF